MVSVRELVDIWCGKCRNSSFCTGTQKPIILTHSSWRIAFISVSWLNFVNLQASKFHRSDKSRTSVAVSAGISVNWLFLQPGQPSNNVTKKLPQVDKEKFIWWEQGCQVLTIWIMLGRSRIRLRLIYQPSKLCQYSNRRPHVQKHVHINEKYCEKRELKHTLYITVYRIEPFV